MVKEKNVYSPTALIGVRAFKAGFAQK